MNTLDRILIAGLTLILFIFAGFHEYQITKLEAIAHEHVVHD
jgi:hypothetical protein